MRKSNRNRFTARPMLEPMEPRMVPSALGPMARHAERTAAHIRPITDSVRQIEESQRENNEALQRLQHRPRSEPVAVALPHPRDSFSCLFYLAIGGARCGASVRFADQYPESSSHPHAAVGSGYHGREKPARPTAPARAHGRIDQQRPLVAHTRGGESSMAGEFGVRMRRSIVADGVDPGSERGSNDATAAHDQTHQADDRGGGRLAGACRELSMDRAVRADPGAGHGPAIARGGAVRLPRDARQVGPPGHYLAG